MIVVSRGIGALSVTRANRRIQEISYSASSMAGSLSEKQFCSSRIRSLVSSGLKHRVGLGVALVTRHQSDDGLDRGVRTLSAPAPPYPAIGNRQRDRADAVLCPIDYDEPIVRLLTVLACSVVAGLPGLLLRTAQELVSGFLQALKKHAT